MPDQTKSALSAKRRRKGPGGENSIPRVILCAGMKSSGSTWLYNVVFEIVKAGLRQKLAKRSTACKTKIVQFYGDRVSDFPPNAASAFHIVVKTHLPDSSLDFLMRFSSARMFLTVREPRDAIASLMERFHHPFEGSLGDIGKGSVRIAHLRHAYNPPVFRYEDGFFDRRETVAAIARMLNVPLSKAEIGRIFERHTKAAVRRRIVHLTSKGFFGEHASPDDFHPRSHWHPGHIGTGTVGKFAAILSISQQRSVLAATAKYCRAFGYEDHFLRAPRERSPKRLANTINASI